VRALAVRGDEATYPIPGEDGATIDRDREVIVARYRGRVYAFALSCPHQHTALRWQPGDQRFQCPKHHSRYTPDGSFISGRATRAMDRFAVRREGATLVVDLARLHRQDQDRTGWDAAFIAA
jgi:nitrite reductase/ring-hydroxylating ferredoxin subunit